MNILDFIFPKRCVVCNRLGSYLCENCFVNLSFDTKNLCLICNKPSYNNLTHPICKSSFAIDGCFSAISYSKTTKKLIYNFKYKPFLMDLKRVLGELFYESLIQNEYFEKLIGEGEWIMVPIPLYKSKLKNRGYNQSEILAIELGKKLNVKTKNLLKRTKDTKTQVGRSDKDRKINLKNAFTVLNYQLTTLNTNVFLVDDIVTTGSTLKEAANVLKRKGVRKVIGLTLARD